MLHRETIITISPPSSLLGVKYHLQKLFGSSVKSAFLVYKTFDLKFHHQKMQLSLSFLLCLVLQTFYGKYIFVLENVLPFQYWKQSPQLWSSRIWIFLQICTGWLESGKGPLRTWLSFREAIAHFNRIIWNKILIYILFAYSSVTSKDASALEKVKVKLLLKLSNLFTKGESRQCK